MESNESFTPAEPTKEQREIGTLAKPLAKYMEYNNMHCAVVLVTLNGVSLYWEGFTANYADNFEKLIQPHLPGLPG